MTLTRATAAAYAALWAATGAGFALAALAHVQLLAVPAPPTHALPATLQTATELLAHNTLVAAWPIALAAVWARTPGLRMVGDALVAASVAVQGLVVGGALGQQPDLWRWLPHLPLEWLGIAVAAGAWCQRRRALSARAAGGQPAPQEPRSAWQQLAAAAIVAIAVLTVAAGLETWAVPR